MKTETENGESRTHRGELQGSLSFIEASFKDLLVLSGTQHHFNIEIAEIKQRDIVSALFQCLNGIVCMSGGNIIALFMTETERALHLTTCRWQQDATGVK